MPSHPPRLRRILLVGEPPVHSAPLRSLAAELEAVGVAAEYSMRAESTRNRTWLKLAWRSDALVLVQYWEPNIHLRRQFQLARLLGCLTVRWWVGTDVLKCLRSSEMAEASLALDRAVDLNIAVAPHLVEELRSVGIDATYVPSVCDLAALRAEPPQSLPRAVLVYLPTDRQDFYGQGVAALAIEANPDLQFLVVGDETHALAAYPNVQSLGWVEEMDRLWPQVGALLRITEHDGLPRMALEALARSRHVIYSWPLEGCRLARSPEEVLRHLEEFKTAGPNHAGRAAARDIGAQAGQRFITAVTRRRSEITLHDRLGSMADVAHCQALLRRHGSAAAAGLPVRPPRTP